MELVAQKTKELTESGKLDLYAKDVGDAFLLASEKIGKHGGKLALLIPKYERFKDLLQSVSAFAGAREGGASIWDSLKAGSTASKDIKESRKQDLVDIAKQKAAAKAAKAAAEAQRQVEAKAAEDKREAEKKALAAAAAAAEKKKEDDKKNAADLVVLTEKREQAEKDVATAIAATQKAAEAAKNAEEKRLAVAEKLAGVKLQQAQMANQAQIGGFQNAAAQNQANINAAQAKIANLAMNREQRREKKLEKRQADREDRRVEELKGRVARGVVLGKDDAAFLAKQ